MAIPDPVEYRHINAKMDEITNDLGAYRERQGAFVNDLNDWIEHFVYSLRDQDIADGVAGAIQAGEIDPVQGRAIYEKFIEVQNALRNASNDQDKLAIFDSLRQFEPVLRKLQLGHAAYNGLPGQPVAPANYPVGPPAPFRRRGPVAGDGGGGGGPAAGPGGGDIFPPVPTGDLVRRPIALSDADAARVDEIAAEAEGEPDANKKPIITTKGNRQARVTDVLRDPLTRKVKSFQVLMIKGNSTDPDVYRQIDVQSGGRSRRNRKSKKRGGYKSRKSRRRTFR
jgi:hypothetical protein